MPLYIIFFIAFVVSFVTVPLLISLANNSGAIAVPGKRHMHSIPTPKFGGIAIALGVLLITPFIFPIDRVISSYCVSSALMVLLGIIDDVRGTNWKMKMAFSTAAIAIIVFGGGVYLENLGNLFGLGELHLGIWGIPFTFVAIFGIINAINLIDGLNGLACGVSCIAFVSFALFAAISGNDTVLYLSLINLGATLGLFKYNYPHASIFMGDSGSLFLGYSIAVLAILLTQGDGTINPMVPVVILGIPIFDTLRVFIIRVRHRRHPFKPDKTHTHHLMIRSGIPLNRVVHTIWILSALMSFLSFVLHKSEPWILMLVLCIIYTFLGIFIQNLRIVRLSNWKNSSQSKSSNTVA